MSLTESDLIQFLRTHLPSRHPLLEHGIGHDGAVLKPGPRWVVSTDAQVENVHFRRGWLTWNDAGIRAAQVALSDLAGMACTPRLMFLDLDIPDGWAARHFGPWATGFGGALALWRAALAGGNLSASGSKCLHAHMTVMGEAGPDGALLRGGSQPGDLVVSPATPGLARLGLTLLRKGKSPATSCERAAVRAWQRPDPVRDAPRCAQRWHPTAGMDLSDGLAADLPRLAGEGRGVVLFAGSVFRRPLANAYRLLGADPETAILGGGEEYQPIWTVPPVAKAGVMKAGWWVLGEVTTEPGLWIRENRKVRPVSVAGFDHFGKERRARRWRVNPFQETGSPGDGRPRAGTRRTRPGR